MCALTGYPLEELLGRKTLEFIAPDHVAKVAAVIASGQETGYESVLIDKQGQRIPVEFIVRTMIRNGERMRMTIVRDIRDRHAAQARIHHLAHHDALTGLPNRMSFMERLEHQMLEAHTQGTRLALLFIDLDHFKRVNDSLGHLVGDTLLHAVGARIVGSLRATDLVARFGGDAAQGMTQLVASLKGNPAAKAVISGFHSASGDAAQNAELAKQRAFAVRDALKSAGIAEDRVVLEKPQVTAGNTSGEDPKSRRVEVAMK